MIRLRSLLLALALIAGALPAASYSQTAQLQTTASAPLRPINRDDFMGMVIRDPWYEFGTNPQLPNLPNYPFQDKMGELLAQTGVEWVRLDIHIPVPWGVPNEAEKVAFEIEKYNYFLDVVAPRHNFKVLALLNFSMLPNDLRLLNETKDVPSKFGGGVNQYMHTYLTRALMVGDRYRDKIQAYEILNEQNRLPLKGDAIKPDVVGRMTTKFYRFCHGLQVPTDEPQHACGNARIILGGLHPRGTSDSTGKIVMTDTAYLKAIYEDKTSFAGFRGTYGRFPIDGVGFHPYPEEIGPSLNDARINARLPLVRTVLEAVGDPCVPFWITEVGYNAGYDPDGPRNPKPKQTASGQGLFMIDVYTSLAERRLRTECGGGPEVANVFWFKYEDFPGSATDPQEWGIVHIPFTAAGDYADDGVPTLYRPTFLLYRELAGLPVNHVFLPLTRR